LIPVVTFFTNIATLAIVIWADILSSRVHCRWEILRPSILICDFDFPDFDFRIYEQRHRAGAGFLWPYFFCD